MLENLCDDVVEQRERFRPDAKSGARSAGPSRKRSFQMGEKPIPEGTFFGLLSHLELTINIRATLSPGDLSAILHHAVGQFGESDKAVTEISVVNTFRPGAPNPTYRYAESTNNGR